MSRRTFIAILLFAAVISIFVSNTNGVPFVYSLTENFTIPTRTSTPLPATATSKPSTNPPPSTNPTETVPPLATVTETAVPVIIAATPVGGFLPTAEACSNQPTIQALNLTRVRSGPGTSYEPIAELVFLEVRPIIGRAADAEWWLIVVTADQIGWVADAIISVQGNTSVIPVVDTPLLNGESPTPGPIWNPPLPTGCEAEPVWTSTPEPTEVAPTNTPEPPTAVPTNTGEPEPELIAEASPIPSDTPEPMPTETPVPLEPTPVPTAVPLDIEPEPSSSSFLPILGGLLLVVGGAVAFMRRRGQEG
ncbi:MAG: hypothetical protein GY943_20940 [Chloroflexi bacterium]|nr:hypothetical protein [Chloroflexota bacterium]